MTDSETIAYLRARIAELELRNADLVRGQACAVDALKRIQRRSTATTNIWTTEQRVSYRAKRVLDEAAAISRIVAEQAQADERRKVPERRLKQISVITERRGGFDRRHRAATLGSTQ